MKVFYLEEKLAGATQQAQDAMLDTQSNSNVGAGHIASPYAEDKHERPEHLSLPPTHPTHPRHHKPPHNHGRHDPAPPLLSPEEIAALESHAEDMRTELVAAKLALEERNVEIDQRDSLLLKARSAIETLRGQVESANKKASSSWSKAEDLEPQLEQVAKDLKVKQDEYTVLVGAFKELEIRQQELLSSNEKMEKENSSLRQRNSFLESTAASLNEAVKDKHEQIDDLTSKLTKAEAKILSDAEELKGFEQAVHDKKKKIDADISKTRADYNKQITDLRSEHSRILSAADLRYEDLKSKHEAALESNKQLSADLGSARSAAAEDRAALADAQVNLAHMSRRLESNEADLSRASEGLASSRREAAEAAELRRHAADATERCGHYERTAADLRRLLEQSEDSATSQRRAATARENQLKLAMSQWEGMLDLYVGDVVPLVKEAAAAPAPAPVPAPAASPSKPFNFSAYAAYNEGGGLSRDLGGSVIRGLSSPSASQTPTNNAESYVEPMTLSSPLPPLAATETQQEPSIYDSGDVKAVSSVFLSRTTAKLRQLAGVKAHFTNLIQAALSEQAEKWKLLNSHVDEASHKVSETKKFVKVVADTIVKTDEDRLARENELRQGIVKSETMLIGENKHLELELQNERSLKERIVKELDEMKVSHEEISTELDAVRSNFAIAQKGVEQGKIAVADALGRISKMKAEREDMSRENDELVRKNLELGGDKARLLDICERMRVQVGYRDAHLGRYAGDVLASMGRSEAHPMQYYQSPASVYAPPLEKASVMVSDSLVARELEATRELLNRGGITAPVASPRNAPPGGASFTPTFLRSTPGQSAFSQQVQSQPQQFGRPASLDLAASYLAPPREEQERRGVVRRELDSKMAELSGHIGQIEDVVKVSASLLDKFEGMKRSEPGPGMSKRLTELENECYQLLDSNARIALQLQQLGLDLQRVYRRFKNLELGGGGGGGGGNDMSRAAVNLKTSDEVHQFGKHSRAKEGNTETRTMNNDEDLRQLYNDLQEGAPMLEGDQKTKAYQVLARLESDARDGGAASARKKLSPEGASRLDRIGNDLAAISARLDGAK